jgi:hypothetical protein
MAACGIGLPIASCPFTYIFLRICLFWRLLVCSGAWVLAWITKDCGLPA